MSGRWFRDVYRDALWEAAGVKAADKAVAEVYARHARDASGDKSATADLAWVTYPRIMEMAGLGRRENVSKSVERLVETGWLTVHLEVPRRPTVYRLSIPATAGSSGGGTTELEATSSDGGTSVVPMGDHGSSVFAAGSSDGGTRPLGPSKNHHQSSLSVAAVDVLDVEVTNEREELDSSKDQKIEKPDPFAVQRKILAKRGITDSDRVEEICGAIESTNNVNGPGWWVTADRNGSLDNHLANLSSSPKICPKCKGRGKYLGSSEYGGGAVEYDCPECSTTRCPSHPTYSAAHCSPCRADRLAGGYRAPSVNLPPGQHTKSWANARERAQRGYEPSGRVHGTHDEIYVGLHGESPDD